MLHMEITEQIARKVLRTVDAGVTTCLGVRVPGHMGVQAAVCYAMDEPHGDEPSCVAEPVRGCVLDLSAYFAGTSMPRSKALRRIAIAQLGTAGTLDDWTFINKLNQAMVGKMLSKCLRMVAPKYSEPLARKFLIAASQCETEPTYLTATLAAQTACYAYGQLKIGAAHAESMGILTGADVASRLIETASMAAIAVDDIRPFYGVTNASLKARRGMWSLASVGRNDLLGEFAEDIVQILVEMKTPGSQFLYLTE
jgi:hypothetical protein